LYNDDPPNIDVGFVGFVGFRGPAPSFTDLGDVPEELGATPKRLQLWNNFHDDFMSTMVSEPSLLILEGSNSSTAPEAAKTVAESKEFKDSCKFFFIPQSHGMNKKLREHIGISDDKTEVVHVDIKGSKKNYVLSDEISPNSIISFIKNVQNGTATKYVKSETRPPNDHDPQHPALYKLTTNSFDELVINSQNEWFVDIWAPWCGPCVAVGPTIELLAELFSAIPTIKVGKFNCDHNEIPTEYFPEPGIPNMKFFPLENKKNPVAFEGERSAAKFVEFIHKHTKNTFNLEEFVSKANELESLINTKKEAKKLFDQTENLLAKHSDVIDDSEKSSLNLLVSNLTTSLAAHPTKESLVSLMESIRGHSGYPKLQAAFDKAKYKNVVPVHNSAQFDEIIAKAKSENKIIIVDFTAVWCGPCVRVAPIFADFSEQYSKLIFLKVDIDECKDIAERYKVEAVPTFKIFKEGNEADVIEGADVNGLKELLLKYNV